MCGNKFAETANTFLYRLRKPISTIVQALKSRTEGMGFNATCRVFSISTHTLQDWENKLGASKDTLMLYSLTHEFISQIIEGDELYTRVHNNKPQEDSEGWTIMLIERASKFIWEFECGLKDKNLFTRVIERLVRLVENTESFTMVTDGERRYGNILLELCNEVINNEEDGSPLTVLKEGVVVGLKNKGQGKTTENSKPKYERPQPEHPNTKHGLNDEDIHANHAEGQNSATRRKLSPYRRRTNTYAKMKEGLQRVLDIYWVIHNFIRSHHTTKKVPAVMNGILEQGLTWGELFNVQLARKN